MKRHRRPGLNALRVLALLAVIGVSIFVFKMSAQPQKLGAYGYPGIFVLSTLANATVVLPAPGIAVIFAMGAVLNPLFVGVVGGAGATAGELSGYMLGFGGQPVLERIGPYERIAGWLQRYGALTILLLAALPNPFFDLAGMSAGALKMPLRSFIFWCLVGKIIKMLFFAYSGAYSIDWLVEVGN